MPDEYDRSGIDVDRADRTLIEQTPRSCARAPSELAER